VTVKDIFQADSVVYSECPLVHEELQDARGPPTEHNAQRNEKLQ
jgi:hypothetical protein